MAKPQIKRRKTPDKNSSTATAAAPVRSERDYEDHEVSDAYHTLKRAQGFVKDKKMMQKVSEHAGRLAQEGAAMVAHVETLAKQGKISTEQMAKLKKNRAIA